MSRYRSAHYPALVVDADRAGGEQGEAPLLGERRPVHPAGVAAEVSSLTVAYDGDCPLCQRCRRWVMAQPQNVPFRFVDAGEPWVERWLGGLVPVGDDLVVVDDWGRAWVGPDAFVVCLWGLNRYRSLSVRLQQAGGRLLAKHVFHSVTAGRGVASLFMRSENGAVVIDPTNLAYPGRDECESRSCTK